MICAANSYCCQREGSTDNCCDDDDDDIIVRNSGFGLPVTQTARSVQTVFINDASGSTISFSGQAPTGAPAANETSSPSTCSSNSTNVVAVGAGIGVPLGTLLIAALVALFFMRKKHKKLQRELTSQRNVMEIPGNGGLSWNADIKSPTSPSMPALSQHHLSSPAITTGYQGTISSDKAQAPLEAKLSTKDHHSNRTSIPTEPELASEGYGTNRSTGYPTSSELSGDSTRPIYEVDGNSRER